MHDGQTNLRTPIDWRDEVTLIPYSSIQILDFGFSIDEVQFKAKRFIERVSENSGSRAERVLIPLTGDDEKDEPIEQAARDDDDPYSVRPVAALEPFLFKLGAGPSSQTEERARSLRRRAL